MRLRAQAAVYITKQDFHMEQKELKGRHSAGNSFLRGLVHHTSFPDVVAANYTDEKEDTWRRALGDDADMRTVRWISPADLKALSQVGCIYLLGPNIERFAAMRMFGQPRSFSICGITHTTASCLQLFTALPVLPLFSWDALICTSTAVRDTLRSVLEDAAAYYTWRFGAARTPLPQLPLIPLGVMADDYLYSGDDRAEARIILGLTEDETAVLFLGRLSFHAKVNPATMFLALEETVRTTGRKVTLILCGWFYNKLQEDAFRKGVETLAPSIRLVVLDGRKADARKFAWSAADIFCSLSDNIQETFGLTPLEAMAAGLPVVVSDWDGYRDTVRHGVDGFRIRTMTPAPPLGNDLAFQYAAGMINYDRYIGQASQATNIDLDECISAIRTLVESPELRRKIGEAGRQRAREKFDWRCIIQQYEELWGELAERRRADAESSLAGIPRNLPEYPDPFRAFGTYATEMLTPENIVKLRVDNPVEILEARAKLVLYQLGSPMCLDIANLCTLLEYLQERGPATVETLAGLLAPYMRERVIFSVLWCAKMGLLQIANPQQPAD